MGAQKNKHSAAAVRILKVIGDSIKLRRKRRLLTESIMAINAGIPRSTLQLIEKGSPTVSIGSYVEVLLALGAETDLILLGSDDAPGRKIQDRELIAKRIMKSKKDHEKQKGS